LRALVRIVVYASEIDSKTWIELDKKNFAPAKSGDDFVEKSREADQCKKSITLARILAH